MKGEPTEVAGPAMPLEDLESQEARRFGERLCEKTAKDWAEAKRRDLVSNAAMEHILAKPEPSELKAGDFSDLGEYEEVKGLITQGELVELPGASNLLVKKLTPEPSHRPNRNPGRFERLLGDEPRRTYVPKLLRPWVMDCSHKEAVYLGEKVALDVLQRYYWWIGLSASVKWWCRACYACQAKKTPRYMSRWPLVSLPLPSRPGEMVAFDLLGPLPQTARGNTYVFLVVDLFSRHAEGYALTNNEKTTKGCASILVNRYFPRWGCPHTLLSDRGAEFTPEVSRAVYHMQGAIKKYTSAHHPQTNGMIERLNHTLCQMLSHLVVDDQKDWDNMLTHAVAAHNNNVSRGTGLAPNQVHIGRYTRLPMTILEDRGARGHQSLKQDQLDYLNLMRDRQIKAYQLVREEDRLIKAKHDAANEALVDRLSSRPKVEAGDWVWLYHDQSAVTGGGKHVLRTPAVGTGGRKSQALVSKLAYCWTGPYKVILVGPGTAADGRMVGPKLLLIDVKKNEPVKNITERVSVLRVKKCFNPHDKALKPKFLPWAMSNYVLNKYSELSPPFHLTSDDVIRELDTHRNLPWRISKHRLVRGLSGKIAVHYYTHWDETEVCTWEHEEELAQHGNLVVRYWTGDVQLVGAENAKYRRYRVQCAKRAEARLTGGRYVPEGFKVCCDTRERPSIYQTEMIGSYVYFKTPEAGWQLARVVMVAADAESVRNPHTIKYLDLARQENVHLSEANLSTVRDEPGTWCWHVHIRSRGPNSVKSFRYTLE